MKSAKSLPLMHAAAMAIEADGADGFNRAVELAGWMAAVALMVAHLRRAEGSMKTCPADPDIAERVDAELIRRWPDLMSYLADPVALFYSGRWNCFDNFSAFTVHLDDTTWPTAEHAYQAAKFASRDVAAEIYIASSAHEAKKRAHLAKLQGCIRPDWPLVRTPVMRRVIRAKHEQHDFVRTRLRESCGLRLVEDSGTDEFWGRGARWGGQNVAAKLWMELRQELYRC